MLLVAGRDLRSRLRDRSGLIAGILAPVLLGIIISLAFGSGADDDPVRIAIADEDRSEPSISIVEEVLRGLSAEPGVTPVTAPDAGAVRSMLDAGEIGAGLVIPEGMGAALTAAGADRAGEAAGRDGAGRQVDEGPETVLSVMSGEGEPVAVAVAEAVAGAIVARAEQTSQAVHATISLQVRQGMGEEASDPPPGTDRSEDEGAGSLLPPGMESFAALAEAAAAAPAGLVLQQADGAEEMLQAASYFGPSMAVLAVLLVMTSAPRALIRERRQGTLQRLRAAAIPSWAPAAGLGLSVAVVGLVAMLVVFTVMTLALGASLGDPVGLAALSVAVVVFAGALSALIASVVSTEPQADGLAMAATFSLALIGGHFIELHALPDGLQTLALATPNGWALRGYTALAADGAGLTEILTPIGVILGFALVTGLLALLRLRRQEA